MDIITIMLFLVYLFGFGYSITYFAKTTEPFLDKNLMRLGIGLGVFIVLGVFLNLIKVPLDWKIFLILSLIIPIYSLIKKIKNKEIKPLRFDFKFTKSNINVLIVLIIFLFCCQVYIGGAFKYNYLEDDDPWSHALSTKYIALEKTLDSPPDYNFQYVNPYPPGYDLLMGVLHQTSSSLSWTLKFFNGLIISLGILFFYFFAKLFMRDRNKALFATFVLALLPSYFTHFIWAHSLVIMLFFPAVYCLEMIKTDKRWMYPAMIVVAAILLTQPTQSIKLGLMLGTYWLVRVIIEKDILKYVLFAELGGLLISFLWWAGKWKGMFLSQTTEAANVVTTGSVSIITKILSAFSPTEGTATRIYSFSDFFFAKPFGMINVHVGWGIVVSILLILGLAYCYFVGKKLLTSENAWISITLVWFIFTFLGTNSMTFNLPVGLFAFRFWLLMAIPVALLSSLGLWMLFSVGKKLSIPKIIILVIIILGVITTAGYQKYNHNTLPTWPPGVVWTSMEEIQGYAWLTTLPIDAKVFSYSIEDIQIVGFDKFSCEWCGNVKNFRESIDDKDFNQLYSFLKENQYGYFIVSGRSYQQLGEKLGQDEAKVLIDNLLNEIQSSNKFVPVHQTQGAIIFRVV